MKKSINHFKISFATRTAKIATLIIILFCPFLSLANKIDKNVQEAFELRTHGKTDQAKELLQVVIENEPGNAIAHFELARILNYMNMIGSDEADQHLKTALELNPENVVFAYYKAKNCFLKAYIALQQGEDNTKGFIDKVCKEFIRVLEIKPDYAEALMYLVEIYGMLPEEMGGDKTKAEKYAQQLEKMDKFYGAKARLVMMPKGTDMAKYWEEFIAENGESCNALKELGVINLFNNDVESALRNFEKAIAHDKSQNIRLLDLARYYHLKVMQTRDIAATELPKSKKFINQYLASVPEPIPPLKAYALGMLAKTEMFLGNQEEGQKLMAEAQSIDSHFSRASAIPQVSLFEPPDKTDHHFRSFFSWY